MHDLNQLFIIILSIPTHGKIIKNPPTTTRGLYFTFVYVGKPMCIQSNQLPLCMVIYKWAGQGHADAIVGESVGEGSDLVISLKLLNIISCCG